MTLTVRARALWETMAGTPVEFGPVAVVAVSAESRLCPPGWTGLVMIDGAAIAVAQDPDTASEVQRALDGLPAASVTDAGLLGARLRISQVLGPAALGYLEAAEFCPQGGFSGPLDPRDLELGRFLSAEDPVDVEESGLRGISSPAFVVRERGRIADERGRIAAVAGYREWPCRTAHLCVLTGASARGRGLGRVAASGAVEHAIREGMLPQWRARSESSKRIATALGFRELGAQLSIALAGESA